MFSYLSLVLRATYCPLYCVPPPSASHNVCVPDRESPRFINEKCKSFFLYFFFFGFPVPLGFFCGFYFLVLRACGPYLW